MYALLALLVLLNLWSFVRVTRTASPAAQAAYVVTAALALLTHTFAAFALAAVNLFWLLRFVRRGETGVTWRRWLTLNAAVIVLFGPWVPATLEVARMGLPWLTRSTPFHQAMIGYAGGVVPAIALAGLCLLAVVRAWRKRDDRVVLLLLLALIPVLGPIAYGTFTTRYGIAAMIALPLLAAYGVAGIGRWACVVVVVLAVVAWAGTSTLGHPRYLNYTPKPDIRAATKHALMRPEGGRNIIATSRGITHVLEHYTRGTPLKLLGDIESLQHERPTRLWLVAPDLASAEAAARQYDYVILTRRYFDGVVLLQLHATRREPATTTGVPSTYPRN
jgi:hypothetical protein